MHKSIRRYLTDLHGKPDHHKKRFALLVSGTATLFIFTIWCIAKFGTYSSNTPSVVATVPDNSTQAVSPIGSLKASVNEALSSLGVELNKAKAGLQSVDVGGSYTTLRNDALNTNYNGQ